MEKNMVKEFTNGQMEIYMLGNLKMANKVGKENIHLPLERYILDYLKRE